MHCVVSWDIKGTKSPNDYNEVNEEMVVQLKPYSWVKPLTTLYIVKVSSTQDWDQIAKNLVAIAKKNTYRADVSFVMSPPINGGWYNGWLPQDLWAKIKARTE